ncbi:MAG: TatD family hydrolase [Firmicutes bacterium]|nr:TatD family hydrolase [Bacillota bacterium]
MIRLIDTHAHLTHEDYGGELDRILARACEAGVDRIITIGWDLPSSIEGLRLADQYPELYAAVGIHPHDASTTTTDALEDLAGLCRSPRVVAIGETGLDYYYDHSPREAQIESFREHIRLARRLNLPVIVHSRDAHADTLKVLREEKVEEVGGVLHCFSGSLEMAEEAMGMGLFISFAGPLTFTNARRLAAVAEGIPLDRLLVETDCPYLTPVPHRGKRNEPAHVALVAARLAEIKGMSLEELAPILWTNSEAAFAWERGEPDG